MKFPLALAALVGCLLLLNSQPAHSAPSILDRIPGVRFFRDLTGNALSTLNDLAESTLDSVSRSGAEIIETCMEGLSCPPSDPDANRNVTEIIRSRGFQAEEYDVITEDGYILTIQRIVNPLIRKSNRARLRPIIMQHGLMSSSSDWVINSQTVRPTPIPPKTSSLFGGRRRKQRIEENDEDEDEEDEDEEDSGADADEGDEDGTTHEEASSSGAANLEEGDSQERPNSLGFYLANRGYDVWLANSRGNIYGQRHVNMSSWQPKFWAFTFDEQIAYDLPAIIKYVQQISKQQKVAYVGHSQGTSMALGLLSEKPEYADVLEPVFLLAPVAFVSHSISPVKYFAAYTPIFSHINMWFGTSNAAVRYLGPIVCGPQVVRRDICANLVFLSVGFDEQELDDSRVTAYLSHMPSGTSVKNVAHYGQEVLSGRFAHFDHGLLVNQVKYGQAKAPDYDLSKIRSKSLVLFHAENDWLASPKDIAKLKRNLKVAPYQVFNMTEVKPKWNHIDYLFAKSAGQLVNTRIHAVLKKFS